MTVNTILPAVVSRPVPREHAEHERDHLLRTLTTLKQAQLDAIVPSPALRALVPADVSPEATIWDRVQLQSRSPSGLVRLTLLERAHRQLAERLKVPFDYYRRMLQEAPALLAETLDTWHRAQPAARLYRMMRPWDRPSTQLSERAGAGLIVRAVLSDRYRPLDHLSLLEAVLPTAQQHGALVRQWSLTPDKLYVRFTGLERDVAQIVAERRLLGERPEAHAVNLQEVLSFGLSLSNSETGGSALAVEPWIEILRCLNGLRVLEKMRVAHLGRKQVADGDEAWMARDTQRVDDAATFLKVRDRVHEIFTNDTQERAVAIIAKAKGVPLALPSDQTTLQWITNAAATWELTEQETAILQEEVLQEQVRFPTRADRQLTPWAVSQGLTALGRRMGEQGDPERRVQLEGMGWEVLTDTTEALLRAGKASTN